MLSQEDGIVIRAPQFSSRDLDYRDKSIRTSLSRTNVDKIDEVTTPLIRKRHSMPACSHGHLTVLAAPQLHRSESPPTTVGHPQTISAPQCEEAESAPSPVVKTCSDEPRKLRRKPRLNSISLAAKPTLESLTSCTPATKLRKPSSSRLDSSSSIASNGKPSLPRFNSGNSITWAASPRRANVAGFDSGNSTATNGKTRMPDLSRFDSIDSITLGPGGGLAPSPEGSSTPRSDSYTNARSGSPVLALVRKISRKRWTLFRTDRWKGAGMEEEAAEEKVAEEKVAQ